MGQEPSRNPGPPAPTRRYTLGSGRPAVGLGACREAVDTVQGRPVWVFLFAGAEKATGDEGFATRAARIRHANVLSVLDHGRWQDTPFVATEPAEATALSYALDSLRATGTWASLEEVRAVFDPLCQAVAAGHRDRANGSPEHGLLSPRSVLLVGPTDPDRPLASEEVKVVDFGLARWLGLRCPMPEGVADARAPEQRADPGALTPAGDVFALGALLATMLCPHEAGLPGRVWADLSLRGETALRAFLSGLRRDVPPGVWDEVGRALSASPSARHPDADRLRAALRRCDWTPVAEAPAPRLRPVPQASLEVSRAIPLPRSFSAEAAAAPMTLRTSPASASTGPPPPAVRRTFTTEAPDTEVHSFATESPDTVVLAFAGEEAPRPDRSFATESPDTVVEPPRASVPSPVPTAVSPTARRRNAPRPLDPPSPRGSPVTQLGPLTLPEPAASAAWAAPPEGTVSVDLFCPPAVAFDDRGRTLPLGMPAAAVPAPAEARPEAAPEPPGPWDHPASAPSGPIAPSLLVDPFAPEPAPPRPVVWSAPRPSDSAPRFHDDLFASLAPVDPPPAPPDPAWRRALVLVAAGLAAALLSFAVGMWMFAPSR